MVMDVEDDVGQPESERWEPNPSGYEQEAGTKMLATRCMFCGRALRTPESVEQGCGPECADKWGVFASEQPVDEPALEAAMATAPEPLQEVVKRLRSDPAAAVSMIVHVTGNAWEHGISETPLYLGAAMELTRALGYPGTARGIQARHIEGRTYSETGHEVGKAKPKGIVVSEHGARWHVALPYIQNYATWTAVTRALIDAGAQKEPQYRVSIAPDRWLHALNAMVDQLAGTLGVLPTGEPFIVPAAKVPVPEDAEAPGGPNKVDPPPPPPPPDVKKGDVVTLNDGREMVVGYVGNGRAGLCTVEDAQAHMKRYGYIWLKKLPREPVWVGIGQIKGVSAPTSAEKKEVEEEIAKPLPREIVERKLPAKIMQHQREGVMWCDERGSGVLAMEQGTGKTLVSIVSADPPVLVLVPASLRFNWGDEITRWRKEFTVSVVVKEGDLDEQALRSDVVVMGYDRLGVETIAKLQKRGIDTLIVDEADACKELRVYWKDTPQGWVAKPDGPARAVAIYQLARVAKRRLFLTGTPMINGRPKELWPLLFMVDPKEWRSQRDYWNRYCDPREIHVPGGRTITNVDGRANLGELRERIMGKFMFRRTKDVLNLPPKVRERKFVQMSEDAAQHYRQAAREFIEWVRQMRGPAAAFKASRAKAIAQLTALRRLCAIGKEKPVLEEALRFLRDTGRPLILMGHHQEPIEAIVTGLEQAGYKVGTILGSDTPVQRRKTVEAFQLGTPQSAPVEKRKFLDVLVCSITAAGKGLTLTRAEDMMIFERVWRPFDLVQAEDRCHRIGTKNKVTIVYYDAPGSIDEKLATLLAEKEHTAAQVIDGIDLDDDEAAEAVMKDMFKELTESVMESNPGNWEADSDAFASWADPL